MDKKDLRIVFMGTPEFAVGSLKILVENGYNVVGVVTMPDKPAGRGHKIQFSDVKNYALTNHLPLLQPEKLKNEDFLSELRSLRADLQIVVAFRMLPEVVWNMPRLGTFNLHASLLPQYRGAAPINWAIINGDKETGVTTFFLTHEIDTGKIILQERVAIAPTDNVGSVHDKLMSIGAKLVQKTVDLILDDKIESVDQQQYYSDESELKPAPKIFKETCRIDWNNDATVIYNFVRGLSPYPAAWSVIKDADGEERTVKIFDVELVDTPDSDLAIGEIRTDGKKYFHVQCARGTIAIKKIQFPGKKAMEITEILKGYKFEEGTCFV